MVLFTTEVTEGTEGRNNHCKMKNAKCKMQIGRKEETVNRQAAKNAKKEGLRLEG